MSCELVTSIEALRRLLDGVRRSGRSVGFVPTMGALHRGHAELIRRCREGCDFAVVSIFVNPLQFDRRDDFERYPQTLDEDRALCAALGVDVVFAPSAAEMYPNEQLATVDVPGLTQTLCGLVRPGHFAGVATVVAKLFHIVEPDAAWFGEKDAQQLAVIRRMVRDLNMRVRIEPVETVREADGLALSSRNRHLSAAERRVAPALYRALRAAAEAIANGRRDAAAIVGEALTHFQNCEPAVRVEYFQVVDPATLQAVTAVDAPVLLAGAIWIGATRLIDNVTAKPPLR